jgi:hypothetical protein
MWAQLARKIMEGAINRAKQCLMPLFHRAPPVRNRHGFIGSQR